MTMLFAYCSLQAQEPPPASDGTPVLRVEFQGLSRVNETYVRRLIRSREGQPFESATLQQDVRELIRSRKFVNVVGSSRGEPDGAVVIFALLEKPEIVSVEVEGNRRFEAKDLYAELPFTAGAVLDRYEIGKAREDILRKYREKGYYYANVTLDDAALDSGKVIYRITEGPRVKVRNIKYEGVQSFSELQIGAEVTSRTFIPIFRTGAIDDEKASRDALAIQNFYRDEAYLDARVGYRLDFDSVDRTDVDLVFVVEEGIRYRVREVMVEGNTVFETVRVLGGLRLAADKWARDVWRRADQKIIQDLYGEIGYVEARIDATFDFTDQPGVVVAKFVIDEGRQSKVGRITIRGNSKTRDEVVRRELRIYPGQDFNTVAMRRSERRISETGLFQQGKVKVTPLEDIQGFREALVEVEEANTIDFLIGGGVTSDNGIVGNLSLANRNFDLFDWPRTWDQFVRGQAFRGRGQTLRLVFEPGTEVTRARIDFAEPYLFDWPVRLDTSLYIFQRDRGNYDEERAGATASLSRRFESGLLDGWAIEGAITGEAIDISDVDPFAARAIRRVRGNSTLTSFKASIVRDTTDSRLIPSEGYRLSLSWEQAGALGGDYTFGKPMASVRWYKTLRTDVFDRKSVLALRGDVGYIVGDAPVFERFYAGGFGSMRGFDYRGISPRKGVYHDAVGGDFLVLMGAEYSVPLYANNVRGVLFVDMGTAEEGFEITGWRVSAGAGVRINLDIFGGIPMIFDFGFPAVKEDRDQTRVFNFSIGASF
ncbi:MAG: outer membrane protein assembly factor BamA [Phycisphaerales bacterium]|nr:outer membrane protein assembly factor BamA [Phycisphaerales bacterium]